MRKGYFLLNLTQKVKEFLKTFKKYPKIYSKILFCATVASKYKRFLRYGNSSAFRYTISKKRRDFETQQKFDKDIAKAIVAASINSAAVVSEAMIEPTNTPWFQSRD